MSDFKEDADIKRRYSGRFSFISGVIVGIIVMIVFSGAHGIYARQRFGGADPSMKVLEIFSILEQNSLLEFDTDYLLSSMYRGLISGLGDNNAQYLDARSFAAFTQRIGGTFVGIGIRIISDPEDGKITVVTVFRGAPAYEAGIMIGDMIINVDGSSVVGYSAEEVVAVITGQENTPVDITIFRPLENIEIEKRIYRRQVEVPSVHHEVHEFGGFRIGYVQITTFDRLTHDQFNNALADLQEQGVQGIVIDLRNNSGGLLASVNGITNMLIPEGIITITEDATGQMINYYSDKTYLGIPLAVLVNGVSASASEILSGAVRDSGVGTIVGENTFGKGSVQRPFELFDGSAIVITVQRYFTPNGLSIDGVGIAPDVYVEMYEELSRRIGSLSIEEDVQLQAAIEVVLGKLD